ncbi:Snx4p [Sugiyamaella lignohabitans]|uniref:Sorting nexin-4 n=1 Tax=Sugiyamaella lignohabitans TaxID=796027 RepID=A0A167D465_9ASCO|nr:Snx4p [Sugiyamaella lignohabitans]ANB12456.1 Snx4p [Sugiyamaella lignohabitans]
MSDFTNVTWDSADADEAAASESSHNAAGPSSAYNDDTFHPTDTDYVSNGDEGGIGSSSEAGPSSSSHLFASTKSDIYFNCLVNDPQKEQDGQNAYITYCVSTETNSPSFQNATARVRRRFSDFVYLYNTLLNQYPAVAVPPLPDKSRLEYIKGDRFASEFTLKRATSLTRFLSRVTHHPLLKKSRSLYTFLESDDWNAYKKHKGGSRLSSASGGGTDLVNPNTAPEVVSVLDGISDTFLNAFAKVNNQSQELIEVKERADKLDDNLGAIIKTFSRVVRRQSDLVHDLDEFSQQMKKLSTLEPQLGREFQEFARGVEYFSQNANILREQVDNDYIVSLRDMENYVASIKGLIRARDQKQLDFEGLSDYLTKAESDRNTLLSGGGSNFLRNKVEDLRGINHEVARKERLNKLESKIKDLQQEVSGAKITSEKFEEVTLNEVAIFESIKSLEMKDTLAGLADGHIEFYQNMIKEWSSIAKTIGAQPDA